MGVTLALALSLLPADPLDDDLPRFVGHGPAEANATFAASHLWWVRDQLKMAPERQRGGWQGWADDAEYCRNAWQTLAYANDPLVAMRWVEEGTYVPCDSPAYRRAKLAELRGLLGDAAYFAGRMPPPVPLAYFRELP